MPRITGHNGSSANYMVRAGRPGSVLIGLAPEDDFAFLIDDSDFDSVGAQLDGLAGVSYAAAAIVPATPDPTAGPVLLARVTGIDLKVGGLTPLYPVPAGMRLIVTSIWLHSTDGTGIGSSNAIMKVGIAPDYDQVVTSATWGDVAEGGYNATTGYSLEIVSFFGNGNPGPLVAGDVLTLDVTAGIDATTLICEALVLGFLVPV